MTLKATTPNPAEVAKHFRDYADILDIYASDQLAMLRRNLNPRDAKTRATVYAEIAYELRTIQFEEGPLTDDD